MNSGFNFRHTTPIQIRFADMDPMQHVNNANYLTYIELARISYFNEVLKMEMQTSPGFILAKATVDFLQPVVIHDELEVHTRCSKIGNKSFELEYELICKNRTANPLVAKAHTVLVAFDYEQQVSVLVPEAWKKKIEHYEQNQ